MKREYRDQQACTEDDEADEDEHVINERHHVIGFHPVDGVLPRQIKTGPTKSAEDHSDVHAKQD